MNNEKHIEIIASRTKESSEVIGNALKQIYEKSAVMYLNELSEKWSSLDASVKTEIANSIAGNYNLTKLMALMEGLSEKE